MHSVTCTSVDLSFCCTIHQGQTQRGNIRLEKLVWISPCGKVVPGNCTHFINYKVSLCSFLAFFFLVFIYLFIFLIGSHIGKELTKERNIQ